MAPQTPREHSDFIATLADEASEYVEAARGVAEDQFGSQVVENIPLLVTQIASLMATIRAHQLMEKR